MTVTFHFNKDATVSAGEQIVVPFKGTGDLNAALEGLPSELKNAAGQVLFTVSKNSAGDVVLTASSMTASLNNLQAEMTATVAFTNPHPVSSTSGTSQSSQSFGFQIGNASSGVYTLTPLTTGNQSNTGVVDDNMQMCDNGLETSFGDGVNWSALQNAVIASKSSTVDVNGITPDTDFYVITTMTSPHATTFTVGNIEDLDTLYPVGNLPQFTNNAQYIDSMATNTNGSFTQYLLCRRTEMHELLNKLSSTNTECVVALFQEDYWSFLVPLFFPNERRPFVLLEESFDKSNFFGAFGIIFAVLVCAGRSTVSIVMVGHNRAFDVIPFMFKDLLFLWGTETP